MSPSTTFAWNRAEGSATYKRAISTFVLTNRYFRAVAKIGYTVKVGRGALIGDRAARHLHAYYQEGPQGTYAGRAHVLKTARTNLVAPLAPVISRG